MSWTGNPSSADANGRFAAAQAALAVTNDLQNRRAARVVAGRSLDAVDCAEMLAMLGLDAGDERPALAGGPHPGTAIVIPAPSLPR